MLRSVGAVLMALLAVGVACVASSCPSHGTGTPTPLSGGMTGLRRSQAPTPGYTHASAGGTQISEADPDLKDLLSCAPKAEGFCGVEGLRAAWRALPLPLADSVASWVTQASLDGISGVVERRGVSVRVLIAKGNACLSLGPEVLGLRRGGASGSECVLSDCVFALAKSPSNEYLLAAACADEMVARRTLCEVRSRLPIAVPSETQTGVTLAGPKLYAAAEVTDALIADSESVREHGLVELLHVEYGTGPDVAWDICNMGSCENALALYSSRARGKPCDVGDLASVDDAQTVRMCRGAYYVEVRALTEEDGAGDPLRVPNEALGLCSVLAPGGGPPPLVAALDTVIRDVRPVRYGRCTEDLAGALGNATADALGLAGKGEAVVVPNGDQGASGTVVVARYDDDQGAAEARRALAARGEGERPFQYVIPEADTPEGLLVAALDAPSVGDAQQLAEEALACVR